MRKSITATSCQELNKGRVYILRKSVIDSAPHTLNHPLYHLRDNSFIFTATPNCQLINSGIVGQQLHC